MLLHLYSICQAIINKLLRLCYIAKKLPPGSECSAFVSTSLWLLIFSVITVTASFLLLPEADYLTLVALQFFQLEKNEKKAELIALPYLFVPK